MLDLKLTFLILLTTTMALVAEQLSSFEIIEEDKNGKKTKETVLKNRHKRYVAFPEGSTFITTICLSENLVLPFVLFTQGINWGISYDLPNITTVTEAISTKNKYILKRRQRRDLYNRVETVLERMGFDGKSCIYRAICESERKLKKGKTTLGQDLLRLFFKYPLEQLTYLEPDDHRKYHWAMRYSLENMHLDCQQIFPQCHFSIIDIALGI